MSFIILTKGLKIYMKKSTLITELTFEEFKQRIGDTAIVSEHRKCYFDKDGHEVSFQQTGEIVTDSLGKKHWVGYDGFYSKIIWINKSLLKIVEKAIEAAEEDGLPNHCICVAIHKGPNIEEVTKFMEEHNIKEYYDAKQMLNYEHSYLDKWLTPQGAQTYLIGCNIKHLYVGKHKFYCKEDYFEFKKKDTEVVYLINY